MEKGARTQSVAWKILRLQLIFFNRNFKLRKTNHLSFLNLWALTPPEQVLDDATRKGGIAGKGKVAATFQQNALYSRLPRAIRIQNRLFWQIRCRIHQQYLFWNRQAKGSEKAIYCLAAEEALLCAVENGQWNWLCSWKLNQLVNGLRKIGFGSEGV